MNTLEAMFFSLTSVAGQTSHISLAYEIPCLNKARLDIYNTHAFTMRSWHD